MLTPVCLGGGDEDANLVLLTPREHFIAHLLLTKFKKGGAYYKMLHALTAMAISTGERKLRSRHLNLAREATSVRMKAENAALALSGRHNFQSEKSKLRAAAMSKTKSETCKHCGTKCNPGNLSQFHDSNCSSLTSRVLATNIYKVFANRYSHSNGWYFELVTLSNYTDARWLI